MNPNEVITAVVPTSPLWCNPSTEIIDETYAQFRKHLPDAEFMVLCDGVHPEEGYMSERYDAYKQNLRSNAVERWNKSYDIVDFGSWLHQSGMLRRAFEEDMIRTPFVFWSEHDIPLNNLPINWRGILSMLTKGSLGAIRFELTGDPPKRNEVKGFVNVDDTPVMLSTQFVNWPQVFRTDYLREFIADYGDARTYLECSERDGIVGKLWSRWQYGIYSPEGEIRRCYHTHGREKNAPGLGKPYIEIDGKRRHIYGSYTPYQD